MKIPFDVSNRPNNAGTLRIGLGKRIWDIPQHETPGDTFNFEPDGRHAKYEVKDKDLIERIFKSNLFGE